MVSVPQRQFLYVPYLFNNEHCCLLLFSLGVLSCEFGHPIPFLFISFLELRLFCFGPLSNVDERLVLGLIWYTAMLFMCQPKASRATASLFFDMSMEQIFDW